MMKVNKILILGNSITRHPGLEGSGWPGINWGMAASAPAKDYVHLLLQRLTAHHGGKAPEAMVESIVDFERGAANYDADDALKKCADFAPDMVIIAIGENVPALLTEEAMTVFRTKFTLLLEVLKQHSNPVIFVRSSFWPDPVKDEILRQVCENAGGIFVDIGNIGKDESNRASAERQFADAGVASHPGNTGMAAIADAIWKAIEGASEKNQNRKL